MTSLRPLRWGILGAGRFGRIHARCAAALPGVQVVALCNRNPDKLAAAAVDAPEARLVRDPAEFVAAPDLDVISVTTHWREHFAAARAALEHGKHVLLEKPMAATAAECQELLEVARRSSGFLMVGHVCRFDPRVTLAQEAIAQGRLGRLVSLHAKRNLPVAPGPLRLDKISPLMGDGIHDADLMMWFLGRAPSRVYAHHVRVDGFQYPDIGWALLEFAGDAVGVIETNWRLPANVPTVIDARLEIVGTAGMLTIDCAHTGLSVLDAQGARQPDTVYWPQQYGRPVGALAAEIAYFADCIRQGTPPRVITPEEAARAVAVMETAEQSAAQGVPLPVNWPLRDPR